jgi:hypothetical protein
MSVANSVLLDRFTLHNPSVYSHTATCRDEVTTGELAAGLSVKAGK